MLQSAHDQSNSLHVGVDPEPLQVDPTWYSEATEIYGDIECSFTTLDPQKYFDLLQSGGVTTDVWKVSENGITSENMSDLSQAVSRLSHRDLRVPISLKPEGYDGYWTQIDCGGLERVY